MRRMGWLVLLAALLLGALCPVPVQAGSGADLLVARVTYTSPAQLADAGTEAAFAAFLAETGPWDAVQFDNIEGLPVSVLGVARAGGVAMCLLGLLLPSVAITIALTAVYTQVQGFAAVQSALRGVIPATVGISVLLLWRLAAPLYTDSRREGRASMAFGVVVSRTSPSAARLRSGSMRSSREVVSPSVRA